MDTEPEIECTALAQSADPDTNALFTPPCSCPRCSALPETAADDGPATIWIPVDGRPVRFMVEDMDLGSTGHSILG